MNNMYDILATMKVLTEGKKPDFLDVDKDGDKKEPFKKAVADKEANKEKVEEMAPLAAMAVRGLAGAAARGVASAMSSDEEVEEGVLGTGAGAALGALAGGPLGAAVGALAGDKVGDELEEDDIEAEEEEWYDAEGNVDSNGAYDAGGRYHAERDANKADYLRDLDMYEGISRSKKILEKYMGFEKLEKSIAAKGDVKDPAAVAAAIGRKKYGKEKFQKAAAAGKKLGEGEVGEGNEFTQARLAAIRAGKPTFSVAGKTYKVKGDTSDEKVMEREFKSKGDLDTQGRPGDTYKTAKGTLTKTKTGVRHERSADEEPEAKDDGALRRRGRPAGTGRKLGAKGPTGKSKLMKETDFGRDKAAFDDHGQAGDTYKTAKGTLTKTKTGVVHRRDVEDEPEARDDSTPRRRGRPAGTGRSIGAKGPTGRSKLMREEGNEIQAAIDLLMNNGYTIGKVDAAEELKEKAVSKAQQQAAGIALAAKREGKPLKKGSASASMSKMPEKELEKFAKTKQKGLPEKKDKKEEVEETTTAGSVATAPAEGGKKSKGGVAFGKGVYESKLEESFNAKLQSMDVTIDDSGNMTVVADQAGDAGMDDHVSIDAPGDDIHDIVRLSGMEPKMSSGYEEACPDCGQVECGCDMIDEAGLANSPEPQVSDVDTMINTLSGGLNRRKTTGQTTIPVLNKDPARQGVGAIAEQVEKDLEARLWNFYKKYQ